MADIVKKLSFDDISGRVPAASSRSGEPNASLLAPLSVFQSTLDSLSAEVAEHFSKVQDAARHQVAGSGQADLRRLRRQFQALKSTFVNFEVKEAFISGLHDVDALRSDQQAAALQAVELEVAKAADSLRAMKAQNEGLRSDVSETLRSVAAAFDDFEALVAGVMERVGAISEEVAEHEASRPPPLTPLTEGPDLAECQAALSEETARAKSLEASLAAAGVANAEALAAAAGDEAELEALRAEVRRLEAAASDNARVADTKAQWQAAADWCERLGSIASKLSGVSVLALSSDSLTLALAGEPAAAGSPAPAGHELTIQLQGSNGALVGARLSPADVDISDVLSAAPRAAQPLPFLVREVRAKLRTAGQRAMLIKEAGQQFPLSPVGGDGCMLRVRLAHDVEAEVAVPPAWPAPGAALRLAALQAASCEGGRLQTAAEAALAASPDLAVGGCLAAFLRVLQDAVAREQQATAAL